MQLTIVLALVCFSQTVLSAPAVSDKEKAKLNENKITSDALELELKGVPIDRPILTHNDNEANDQPTGEENGSDNNGGPEVKRSERVDVGDVPVRDVEADLRDLSGNMKAADQDVKAVLRTFFQNLKQHPEIVEDIIEREGAKLMDRSLEEEGSDVGDGVIPVDVSDFQQPSPQLIKSPKQVEKKTGAFPEYPRFIYKSPMRNMKERNQLTAGSQNSPKSLSQSTLKNAAAHNAVVNGGSDVKAPAVDLSNAIPVIQQPSTNQDPEEEQVNELLSSPEEGGAIDLATLQRAQEEYSHAHPFMNTLPLFPDHPKDSKNSEDIVKPEQKTEEKPSDSDAEAESSVESKEIMNTHAAEDSEESGEQGPEADDKRSESSAESEEEKDVQDTEGSWSETQAGEHSQTSKETAQHKMTGSEIAAETLNSPVESQSSVTFRPYYYYYYNEDGERGDEGQLDAAEEGDGDDDNDDDDDDDIDTNEDQLQKISSEAGSSEEERRKEADDSKDHEDEGLEEGGEEEDKEEEEADDSDTEADDSVEDESNVQDEEEAEEETDTEDETDGDETEDTEKHVELDNEQSENSKADDKTNSKSVSVEETMAVSDPKAGTPRLFKSKGLMLDKNEADLMSLHGDEQRQTANRPIAGQPM